MRRRPFAPRPPLFLAAGLSALLAACAPQEGGIRPVVCATRNVGAPARPPQPGDTLDVLVRLDSLGTGDLLVRVDPLDEDGVVKFLGAPPATAAAVGLALTPAGVFQGCAGEAPGSFLLHGSRASVAKAWLRVSAGRPVRVRLQGGSGEAWSDALAGGALVVPPGASGRRAWAPEAGG